MPTEIELKLRIAATDIAKLKRHPAITSLLSEKPKTRRLVSIYYDTPQLALLDQHISLRVRRMSGGWFQAVKSGGGSLAGLHQRMEWEDIVASAQPDFTKITDPTLEQLFASEELRAALKPIFTTDMQRTEWQLIYPDATHIELALDVGHVIIDNEKRDVICEIELEIKSGHHARLFELALELQKTIPLELENVSKAQRGYAFYRPCPPTIKKASATHLEPSATAADAFRQIAWECLAHLQGNQDVVLYGDDIEGVHQMRVALRRLRSLFSVFSAVVNRASSVALIAEIKWISELLGQARDLDVFISETLPPMLDAMQQPPGLLQLLEKACHAQTRAYADIRTALHSQRYHRLLLAMGVWLENRVWVIPESAQLTVSELSRQILSKRHKQLKKHGQRLAHMHPEERHETRITAKKFRYAAEFFTSLSTDSSKNFIKALADVQGILGILNDIATTEGLIQRLIGARPNAALNTAQHLIAGWNACHANHRLAHMHGVWTVFSRQKPFWRSATLGKNQ